MAYPNAGLPNELGEYDEAAEETAAQVREWLEDGLVNIVGGCCGTTPGAYRRHRRGGRGRRAARHSAAPTAIRCSPASNRWCSPRERFPAGAGARFVNIGERTNVTGSARFKKLILAGDYDAAVEVARQQVENGAQIIDVNMDEALLDGEQAMTTFLKRIAAEPDIARVPVMIDSSKWSVIEAGLKCVSGKPIVNSISLKEGEEPFLEQARKVRAYGAAVVVMAFDETGQADTHAAQGRDLRARLQTAASATASRPRTSSSIPTSSPSRPGSTSIAATRSTSSRRPREIRARCPHVHISGGLSNLSFSFRGNEPVRRAMHSVFLYHAIPAGHGHGDRQRRPARRLRRDRSRAARGLRGRHPRPARRRDRAADHARRALRGTDPVPREEGGRMARLAGRASGSPMPWSRASTPISSRIPRKRGRLSRARSR